MMVRRVRKEFPKAKLIFAHPFVENPEAQFSKHEINEDLRFAKSYEYGAVGKAFVFKHKGNKKDYFFSPFSNQGHQIKNSIEFEGGFKKYALSENKSILVYVSKRALYKEKYLDEFSGYIKQLPDIANKEALGVIEKISNAIGANNHDHKSKMVALLRKGVVIHHGSIPLEVRLLIEDFVKKGFSTLCFATSTLAQGVNMPFDIVWLDSNRFFGDKKERALAFKNLIGRSGRLTKENKFDYGYVYTDNPRLFSEKMNEKYYLEPVSVVNDIDFSEPGYIGTPLEDAKEFIESVRDNEFDEEYEMPVVRLERLFGSATMQHAEQILDLCFSEGNIEASIAGPENKAKREKVRALFRSVYENYLGRSLRRGEKAVFDAAIFCFFLVMIGRSFKEIVSIRYNWLLGNGRGGLNFLQPAVKLPKIDFDKPYPLYYPYHARDKVSYDLVVFDTYDYLDQVISFSLADVFIAIFDKVFERKKDARAESMVNFFKYGTEDKKTILLLRYGFSAEQISEIKDYVSSIDESVISFEDAIQQASEEIKERVEWYR